MKFFFYGVDVDVFPISLCILHLPGLVKEFNKSADKCTARITILNSQKRFHFSATKLRGVPLPKTPRLDIIKP